jgi:hypothetical protein
MPLPTNADHWALWLFDHLEDIAPWSGGAYRGVLPQEWNFQEINDAIEGCPINILGVVSEGTRSIEFYPEIAGVYENIDCFLAVQENRRFVPARFAICSPRYVHGDGVHLEIVHQYIEATKLWELVCEMADYDQLSGYRQNFIDSHDAKLAITLDYGADDLCPLEGLQGFVSEFQETDTHKRQKRNIFRSTLIETFRGSGVIPFSELLGKFVPFVENARNGYTMYASDFSYQKVKESVERQNLEDMLRLNKVFSDLQNQLLALPAALLLAGASVHPDNISRNIAVLIGVFIFVVFMWALVGNQLNSLGAISGEIKLRKNKLNSLPEDVSSKFSSAFGDLERRRRRQKITLYGVRFSAILVLFVVGWMIFIRC